MNDVNKELEEQRELASGRLSELETLQSQYQSSLRTCEQLTMDVSEGSSLILLSDSIAVYV